MIFDLDIVWVSLPVLITAAGTTIQLTVCILLLGAVLALPVALANVSGNRVCVFLSEAYILIFRGTPALVQLFIVYFGLSQFEWIRDSWAWVLLRDAFWCAVLALGLNSAAYTGRMLAGALKNIPHRYVEAAHSLGLSNFAIFVKIKAPLAIRMILPSYGNEVILTMKATALGSAITLQELMGEARLLVSETYAPYEVFLSAGIIYLVLTFSIGQVFGWLELRLDVSTRATGIASAKLEDTAK